jgi:hypothetical protein
VIGGPGHSHFARHGSGTRSPGPLHGSADRYAGGVAEGSIVAGARAMRVLFEWLAERRSSVAFGLSAVGKLGECSRGAVGAFFGNPPA